MELAALDAEVTRFQPVGCGGTFKLSRRELARVKIFVGSLPPNMFSLELFRMFESFGKIREAVVLSDRFRTRSRCYGFVTFVKAQSAQKAMKETILAEGKPLQVKLAITGAKGRRAEFFVRHGSSSGYPQLKFVEGTEEKLIHCDPNLYRTANIQHIPAAKLHLSRHEKSRRRRCSRDHFQVFPNKDIAKDYALIKIQKVPASKTIVSQKPERGTTPDCQVIAEYLEKFPITPDTSTLTTTPSSDSDKSIRIPKDFQCPFMHRGAPLIVSPTLVPFLSPSVSPDLGPIMKPIALGSQAYWNCVTVQQTPLNMANYGPLFPSRYGAAPVRHASPPLFWM